MRDFARIRKFQEMFRPGLFSDNLRCVHRARFGQVRNSMLMGNRARAIYARRATRRALGIGPNEPPPFLHRMAVIGYPPGYTRPPGSNLRPDLYVRGDGNQSSDARRAASVTFVPVVITLAMTYLQTNLQDKSSWAPSTLKIVVDKAPPEPEVPDGPFEEPLPVRSELFGPLLGMDRPIDAWARTRCM